MTTVRKSDDWSLLRSPWLRVPLTEDPASAIPTWETFAETFDLHLQRVSAYVRNRVSDRGSLERIVTHVIRASLGIMSREGAGPVDAVRLEASADLLIAIEAATGSDQGKLLIETGSREMRERNARPPIIRLKERRSMSGRTDRIKGRAKQAAGVLIGNKSLEHEGRVDRAGGAIKETAEVVVDRVKSAIRRKRT